MDGALSISQPLGSSTGTSSGRKRSWTQTLPTTSYSNTTPPAKLVDTFKETLSEAKEGFPDLSITVEDVMAEGDRVAADVLMQICPRSNKRPR